MELWPLRWYLSRPSLPYPGIPRGKMGKIGPVLSETNAETKREDVFKEQLMLMSLKSLLCVSFSIVSIQRAE